jgi:hypothetical protein
MRSMGAVVLLAGIGVALFVYLPVRVDRDISLQKAQQSWEQARRSNISYPRLTTRLLSPQVTSADLEDSKVLGTEEPAVSAGKGENATVVKSTPEAIGLPTLTGWEPMVINAYRQIKSGSGVTSLEPKSPTDRYKLVVKMQRKLKKRGCYWGRIDGSWGAGSKYAMQAFVDRVNANLPVEEPDYVLLALIQTNGRKTCDGCPAGQIVTDGGGCIPQTILAERQRGSGRGGGNGAKVFSWRKTSTTQPLFRPVGTTIVTTAPLSGRMAIGGPQQFHPPLADDDLAGRSVAAVNMEDPRGTQVAQPPITRAPAVRRKRRAARRETNRSRRRYRGVRAARRRNLMLGLGGAY